MLDKSDQMRLDDWTNAIITVDELSQMMGDSQQVNTALLEVSYAVAEEDFTEITDRTLVFVLYGLRAGVADDPQRVLADREFQHVLSMIVNELLKRADIPATVTPSRRQRRSLPRNTRRRHRQR